jgi:hypothetical protein
MKNLFKVFGIIAFVTVIGFSFAACGGGGGGGSGGSGGGGGGGGDDGGSGIGTGGTFTLTDIPAEYNGKYVYFGSDMFASIEVRGCANGKWGIQDYSIISDGEVIIPLWIDTKTKTGIVRYTNNDTLDCRFNIYSSKTSLTGNFITQSFFSVTFSNGNATRSWNDLTGR